MRNREINHVKTRPQEVKTEPSLRETRYTVLRKEDKIENKNKEQDRESQKEMNFSICYYKIELLIISNRFC